jgi:hypothetical protein
MLKSRHFSLLICTCLLLIIVACAPQPAAEPTSPPAPSATMSPTETPAPTSTPDPALCLQGNWLVGQETAAQLLRNLSSTPSLQIKSGSLYLSFSGDTFAYHSDDLALRSEFLDSFLDVKARIRIEGTFTGEPDNRMRFTQTGSNNELYEWEIVKDDYYRPFMGTTPIFEFQVAQEGEYVCLDNTLALTLLDEGEEILLVLTRAQ